MSHPPRPYLLWGIRDVEVDIFKRDWKFWSRLKISSEIEFLLIVGPSGIGWSPTSGKGMSGTSRPSLGVVVALLFSIFRAKCTSRQVYEYTCKSQTFFYQTSATSPIKVGAFTLESRETWLRLWLWFESNHQRLRQRGGGLCLAASARRPAQRLGYGCGDGLCVCVWARARLGVQSTCQLLALCLLVCQLSWLRARTQFRGAWSVFIRTSSTTTRDRNLQFRGAVSTGGSPLDFLLFLQYLCAI